MVALLRANTRAGELKRSAVLGGDRPTASPPGVVRGAPSHDLAYLLAALEESGWRLARTAAVREPAPSAER